MLMPHRIAIAAFAVGLAAVAVLVRAAEDSERAGGVAEKTGFLKQMTERVGGVQVKVMTNGESKPAVMIERPVFRYSDQERRISDATLWIWTDQGRPVALQKEEAGMFQEQDNWTVCFASLSPGLIDVRWPRDERGFTTSSPGCEFHKLPDGPAPAGVERLIAQQVRQVARRFSATHEWVNGGRSEARLLPRPIYEYAMKSPNVTGAVFGFAAHATNPDGYILIELREGSEGRGWYYACARMTTSGIKVSLDGEDVWSCEEVPSEPKYFDNWTFFFEPRPTNS
jgi:hypothetical protein